MSAALHPETAQLERFLRGEMPREEARSVVRHLLRGCPQCGLVTRRLWGLGDRPCAGGSQSQPNDIHGGMPQ